MKKAPIGLVVFLVVIALFLGQQSLQWRNRAFTMVERTVRLAADVKKVYLGEQYVNSHAGQVLDIGVTREIIENVKDGATGESFVVLEGEVGLKNWYLPNRDHYFFVKYRLNYGGLVDFVTLVDESGQRVENEIMAVRYAGSKGSDIFERVYKIPQGTIEKPGTYYLKMFVSEKSNTGPEDRELFISWPWVVEKVFDPTKQSE